MKILKKSLKASIALFLAVLISKLLKLKYPFFVALPTIMPLTNSEAETLKAGRNRMIGTILGALVGAVLVVIQPDNPFLGAIGITIIIYFCSFIRWNSSASIAGLVFVSILVGIKGQNPWLYSINRIGDTFVGILISIFVNNVIFHTNFLRELNKSCNRAVKHIDSFINETICLGKEFDLDTLYKHIETISNQLDIYQDEFTFKKSKLVKIEKYDNIVNNLSSIFNHVKFLYTMSNLQRVNDINYNLLKTNGFCTPKSIVSTNGELDIVFNYHLNELLTKLNTIKSSLKDSDI